MEKDNRYQFKLTVTDKNGQTHSQSFNAKDHDTGVKQAQEIVDEYISDILVVSARVECLNADYPACDLDVKDAEITYKPAKRENKRKKR